MIQSPWCACEWIQSNLSSLEMDTFFLLFHSYRCLPLLQYMSISAINWFTREGKHVTICHKLVYQRENRIVAPLLHLLPKYNSYGQHQSTVNNKTTSHLHTQNFSLKKWNKLCNTAADDKWNNKKNKTWCADELEGWWYKTMLLKTPFILGGSRVQSLKKNTTKNKCQGRVHF